MTQTEVSTKRILVIDDEDLLTRSLKNLLKKSGYEPFIARNGEEGEAIAAQEDLDVIISDIRMPGKNGVDTIKAIRAGSRNQTTPVIFITGFADSDIECEANRLKPLAYFSKPFDSGDLLGVIEYRFSP